MEVLNNNGQILMDYRAEFKRHYADSVDSALKNAVYTLYKENFENGQDYQGMVEEMMKLQKDVVMYRGSGGDQFLATMISDVTVDTEESILLSDNYTTIVNTVEKQRTSISGVDEDEEALDLVKFQNAYNLCSKVVQIMSEMYDRLITNTGV